MWLRLSEMLRGWLRGLDSASVDGPGRAVAAAERELAAALADLAEWAPDVAARHRAALDALRAAWALRANHLRTVDRMVADLDAGDARRAHWGRLRERGQEELLHTLAWVRELLSMLRLARRTATPRARAEELLAQLATAGAGLTPADDQTAARVGGKSTGTCG